MTTGAVATGLGRPTLRVRRGGDRLGKHLQPATVALGGGVNGETKQIQRAHETYALSTTSLDKAFRKWRASVGGIPTDGAA